MKLLDRIAETIFAAKSTDAFRSPNACLSVMLTPRGWADAERELANMLGMTYQSFGKPIEPFVRRNMSTLIYAGVRCHLIEAAVPETLIFIGELAPEIKAAEPVLS